GAAHVLQRGGHGAVAGTHVFAGGVADRRAREVVEGCVTLVEDRDQRPVAHRLGRGLGGGGAAVGGGGRNGGAAVPAHGPGVGPPVEPENRLVLVGPQQRRVLYLEGVRRVLQAEVVGVDVHAVRVEGAGQERAGTGAGADPPGHGPAHVAGAAHHGGHHVGLA